MQSYQLQPIAMGMLAKIKDHSNNLSPWVTQAFNRYPAPVSLLPFKTK